MIQQATRAADFGSPIDGEQHARFVVRPHQREQRSVVSSQWNEETRPGKALSSKGAAALNGE